MEIKRAIEKKKVLEKDIKLIIQNYCEQTGLKFNKINILSFYDVEESKGLHNITMEIRNPF